MAVLIHSGVDLLGVAARHPAKLGNSAVSNTTTFAARYHLNKLRDLSKSSKVSSAMLLYQPKHSRPADFHRRTREDESFSSRAALFSIVRPRWILETIRQRRNNNANRHSFARAGTAIISDFSSDPLSLPDLISAWAWLWIWDVENGY